MSITAETLDGSRVELIEFRYQVAFSPQLMSMPDLQRSRVKRDTDDIVSNLESFFAMALRSKNPFCLFSSLCVAGQQALNLGLFVTVDDKDTVNKAAQ